VHPQVFLLVHLDAEPFQSSQRGEGVENVPFADAVLTAAEDAHLDSAVRRGRNALHDHRVDVFRVLNIQPRGGHIDELGHVIARIRIAPQQAFPGRAVPVQVLPVGVEDLDDLPHMQRIVGDDPVVTGQREIFDDQVESRDQRRFFVHHDGLFMGDVELRIGPLDGYSGCLELFVRLVVRPVSSRPRGVEHDPHLDAGVFPADDRLDQTFFGECELFYQQG